MSTKLDTFKDIPDEMLWKGNALDQIEEFKKLAKSLGLHWATVGYHTSKSIPLPVVRFSTRNAQVYVRDNFYDINVCVVSKKPITTPLSVLFDGIITPEPWIAFLKGFAKPDKSPGHGEERRRRTKHEDVHLTSLLICSIARQGRGSGEERSPALLRASPTDGLPYDDRRSRGYWPHSVRADGQRGGSGIEPPRRRCGDRARSLMT